LIDDDALFGKEEDENEEGAFVMYVQHSALTTNHESQRIAYRGNFTDSLGEDFLGLRELGIADEFGLSSLSVPKKLLKGKNRAEQAAAAA
jgi:transcriptional activator SPT7